MMSIPRAPLSRNVQVRILGMLLHGQSQLADDWEYGVSDSWLGKLKESLNNLQASDVTIPPLTCSFNDSENSFLGESSWKILVSWYGLADDYELHRRPSSSKYMQVPGRTDAYILADRNLDFVHVSICFLDHIDSTDKQLYHQIFFWEDFNFLKLHLQRALGIPVDRQLRVWVMVKKETDEEFLGTFDSQMVQAGVCSFGSFLCSKLPSLLEVLIKRQELPPPTACEASLSSFSSTKTHLTEVLQKLGINVMLCVEETGCQDGITVDKLQRGLPGISPYLLVSKRQHDWAQGLDQLLDTFEKEIQFSAKTKRDELYTEVKKLVSDNFAVAEKVKAEAEAAEKEVAVREKRLCEREKELDEREHDLNTKVDKFKRGLTDYLIQRKKLEEELKRIEQQNQFSDTRVELNVGGVKYTTSTVTLTKASESILALMFSGRHHIQKEADGSYFIDRDGTHFRHILNYLRDGARAADSMPGQPSILNELLVEADYFQLASLSNVIKEKKSNLKSGPYASMPS